MEQNQQVSQQPAQLKPVDRLKQVFNAKSVQEQFNNVLKDNAPAFMASVIDLVNASDYLQKCDPNKVVIEALKAAILKLPINKNLGFAYIVPYGSVPTMTIGYKGYIQLAMRTGQYKFLNADKVFEGEYVTSNKLTGEFDLTGKKKSEKVIGFFCYMEMLNGFSKTLYMTVEQVTAHGKKYSKSFNDAKSTWKTDFDAMATKTVIRGLLTHYGYLSLEMATAINSDIESDNISDKVENEIKQKGNNESIGFTDFTEVKENEKNEIEGEGSAPY
jgi:recombination protein RecT